MNSIAAPVETANTHGKPSLGVLAVTAYCWESLTGRHGDRLAVGTDRRHDTLLADVALVDTERGEQTVLHRHVGEGQLVDIQKCPLIVSVGVLIEPLSEPEVLNSSSRLGV